MTLNPNNERITSQLFRMKKKGFLKLLIVNVHGKFNSK